jgi:predicted outer membrane repeat protein
VDIFNALFANNHASYQGGALFGGSDTAVTLTNTIFYNNTLNAQTLPSETKWQGYHTNRTLIDGGNNIQYPRYKPDFPGNDVNNLITSAPIFADPLLLGLASNGGPTQTMALQAGSPAINYAVASKCPAFDQRGFVRQDSCDIGPFEYGGLTFTPSAWLYLPSIRK